jgi:N-formylglutamate amidohydrolase
MENRSYCWLGPRQPDAPVLISVPHAGRDYPPGFALLSRLPVARLKPLEDRYADLLVDAAISAGHAALVACTPRAWIDLNRAEREFDPGIVSTHGRITPLASAKVRGGLGIVPRRVIRGGDIWRGGLSADAFEARLAGIHRPWHQAISSTLESQLARFGVAILIDLHSMPPIAAKSGDAPPPQIVVGDLFGRSARGQFSQTALALAERHGLVAALNAPYAGGHILERHGNPARGIHALQIEVDRSLYLDPMLDQPGSGLARCRAFVADLANALADEARAIPLAEAAE